MDEVLRLSDHLLLLESGRVLASGAPNALALRPESRYPTANAMAANNDSSQKPAERQ